ncbi:putative transcription factor IIS [Lupinus albus]|uniref:Putative transcription factor IIS n=1 Tax=Lupinus albus TaxID=3870 RepID=A0A6A4NAX8_LUPAL|nr:putative transcription factor IIS [Lupinus albus]
MALEDFFTLSEMKDGLTAPSRVQELVSVMQKEKDCVAKNAGDAARQWSAVASTIAATENKDCLDLFIQLDGLWFINRWLKDAQNFALDANYSFIEESITAMLRAVEQLHLDDQKSVSSGIHATVSNLLDHHSSKVQNKAKVLFDSWKGSGNDDGESHDIAEVNNASGKSVREEGQPSVTEAGNDNDHASGLVGSQKSLLRSPDNSPSERIASVQIQSSGNASVECEEIKDRSPNYLASFSSSAPEAASLHEGLPLYAPGKNASVETCNLPVPKQDNFEGQPDDVLLSDFTKKEQQEQNVNGPPEKLDTPEICSVSTKLEPEPVSMGAIETKALEPVKETTLKHNVENNEVDVCHKIVISDGTRTASSDRKSGVDHIIAVSRVSEYDDDRPSNMLWDSSVSESELGKSEILEMSISGTEYVRTVKEGKGRVSSEGENTSNASDSNKPGKGSRSPRIMDKKGSADEFDNGTVDAIEVTRQIALEIEREVLSSSSEKIAQGGIRQPGSPDSVKKEDEPTLVLPKEVSSRESHSTGACSDVEQRASISNIIEADLECRPNMESLQVTEAAEDSGGNSEKRLCMFDLNEDGSDDMDVSVNAMSTTIPVVSASKPAPNPGLPGSPLQFEGTLGWKGSAATSAFRPASPRNSERNLSVGGSSDISKQRQDWVDFDLNVAEGDERQTKPFAELPVEFSPKRSSRLELDLNSIGDDCDAQPSDQRMEGQLFLGRNGYWSPSPASSTSSMQPSVRNIDLNDSLQTDLVDQGPGKSSHFIDAFGRSKSDAPVISIFGTRVEISRREEYVPPTLFLRNGKAIEPAIDLTMSRAGGILGIPPTVSYNHSSVFGYNGVASASTPPLSYSSAMYGSGGMIPYMVDSRGASVVPQVAVGSSSTVLPSYSQPPYMMNMTGTQLALNGIGPPHPPNLDLNSGFMIEGGGNRDALTARQFFFPGQGTMLQPSSSGVGGKRKEPDSGWESYPFNYKHPQPPWK